jgi:hypothetical protein
MGRSASAPVFSYISYGLSRPANERQVFGDNQFLMMHINGFVHPLF